MRATSDRDYSHEMSRCIAREGLDLADGLAVGSDPNAFVGCSCDRKIHASLPRKD